MNILLLCEGDAETHDSWSGVSRSLVLNFRDAGHTVIPVDVDLYGLSRLWHGVRAFRVDPTRWRMTYRFGPGAFEARSRLANQQVQQYASGMDVILQAGATFRVDAAPWIPRYLYCDSNIALSSSAAHTGVSEASALTDGEIDEIRERECSVYEGARFIFTMSDQLRESFSYDFGIPDDRLMTVHCGPNVPLHNDPSSVTRPTDGPPTILFVGRDFQRKGGDLLLDAFRIVRERIAEAELVLVGGKPSSPQPEGVRFLGYLDRDTSNGREAMKHAYRTADIFCLPTRFDPFGTSFIEAMSYSLPCVGPDAWAVPEIILDGETGRLCPPEDPDALAVALIELLEDGERRRRMGSAARQRVLDHFTWDGIVDRMSETMIATLPESPSRARNQR